MNIDPFFDNNAVTTADKSIRTIDSCLVGFFLCSFDLTNGLNILFSSPFDLKDNSYELSILKTHCIWKLEKIPLRIDLKVSEFVYSAFQLHGISKNSISATTKEPLYGGVLKLWKTSKTIPSNIILKFKTKLEEEISTNLNLLFRRNILSKNPIKRREFNELTDSALEIEKTLLNLWKEFEGEVNAVMESNISDIKHLDKISRLEEKKKEPRPRLFMDKITMRKIITEENPDHIMAILVNQSETLKNVKIHVSRISEFFSEILWEEELEEWPLKEDLILEFPKSNIMQKFLIKVSSNKATISIKTLEA